MLRLNCRLFVSGEWSVVSNTRFLTEITHDSPLTTHD